MKHSASWKILIAGAAMAGLGFVGAGTSAAAETAPQSNRSATSSEYIVTEESVNGESGTTTRTDCHSHVRTATQHREAQAGYVQQFGSPYDSYYGSYYYGSN